MGRRKWDIYRGVKNLRQVHRKEEEEEEEALSEIRR
jgi:hypothetical protein